MRRGKSQETAPSPSRLRAGQIDSCGGVRERAECVNYRNRWPAFWAEYQESTKLLQFTAPLMGISQIIAIVAARNGIGSAGIRKEMSNIVPPYMVPNQIHVLEGLPKNDNGKIDRNLLKNSIAKSMKLSVVTTLYQSAPYITEFVQRTRNEVDKLTRDYEIILVDDGSPDESLRVALSLLSSEPGLRVIELSRNFGHHKAMMTGLEYASGDLVFLIDVDLEEPPELVSRFLSVLRDQELDVVFGFQGARKGSFVERVGGQVAWRFLNMFLPVKIPHSHSTVRLMSRDYVQALVKHKEHKTAIGGLWVMTGFRQKGVEFEKSSRVKSSYSLRQRLIALLDSITSFSELPLFLIFYIGCAVIFGSLVIGAYLIIRHLSGHLLEGWASTMVSISFFGGLAVFSIGVVGLYVSRIFIETKGRPYTIIRRIHGQGSRPPIATTIEKHYADYYSDRNLTEVYPVEFVVRAFLGTYPDLRMPRGQYEGKRILDLGYGDGRNMPLLSDLGMEIHGVEISHAIHRHVQKRLTDLDIRADLRTGSNVQIPYEDGYFEYVLACHSCYYVKAGDTFDKNLGEIARVLEPGGFFVASLPMTDTFILKGAKPLPGGHYQINNDPYGLRKGVIFRAFASEREIQKAFQPFFYDLSIGYCDDMFWGIHQKVWTVVCRRKS